MAGEPGEHVMPSLAARRVDAIATGNVTAVLRLVWSTKRQTAHCLRRRIGAVLEWTLAQCYREDTPTNDVVSSALPSNRAAPKHQRALPHAEVGVVPARVCDSGMYTGTVLSFEFLVLFTAALGRGRGAQRTLYRDRPRRGGVDGAQRTHAGGLSVIRRHLRGREHVIAISPSVGVSFKFGKAMEEMLKRWTGGRAGGTDRSESSLCPDLSVRGHPRTASPWRLRWPVASDDALLSASPGRARSS